MHPDSTGLTSVRRVSRDAVERRLTELSSVRIPLSASKLLTNPGLLEEIFGREVTDSSKAARARARQVYEALVDIQGRLDGRVDRPRSQALLVSESWMLDLPVEARLEELRSQSDFSPSGYYRARRILCAKIADQLVAYFDDPTRNGSPERPAGKGDADHAQLVLLESLPEFAAVARSLQMDLHELEYEIWLFSEVGHFAVAIDGDERIARAIVDRLLGDPTAQVFSLSILKVAESLWHFGRVIPVLRLLPIRAATAIYDLLSIMIAERDAAAYMGEFYAKRRPVHRDDTETVVASDRHIQRYIDSAKRATLGSAISDRLYPELRYSSNSDVSSGVMASQCASALRELTEFLGEGEPFGGHVIRDHFGEQFWGHVDRVRSRSEAAEQVTIDSVILKLRIS